MSEYDDDEFSSP